MPKRNKTGSMSEKTGNPGYCSIARAADFVHDYRIVGERDVSRNEGESEIEVERVIQHRLTERYWAMRYHVWFGPDAYSDFETYADAWTEVRPAIRCFYGDREPSEWYVPYKEDDGAEVISVREHHRRRAEQQQAEALARKAEEDARPPGALLAGMGKRGLTSDDEPTLMERVMADKADRTFLGEGIYQLEIERCTRVTVHAEPSPGKEGRYCIAVRTKVLDVKAGAAHRIGDIVNLLCHIRLNAEGRLYLPGQDNLMPLAWAVMPDEEQASFFSFTAPLGESAKKFVDWAVGDEQPLAGKRLIASGRKVDIKNHPTATSMIVMTLSPETPPVEAADVVLPEDIDHYRRD